MKVFHNEIIVHSHSIRVCIGSIQQLLNSIVFSNIAIHLDRWYHVRWSYSHLYKLLNFIKFLSRATRAFIAHVSSAIILNNLILLFLMERRRWGSGVVSKLNGDKVHAFAYTFLPSHISICFFYQCLQNHIMQQLQTWKKTVYNYYLS